MKCIFCKKECIRKNNNVCSECSTSGKEYNNNINKMNELTEEQKITMQKFADKTKDNPKEIIDLELKEKTVLYIITFSNLNLKY